MYGTISSLPPLVNEGGGLVRESVGKTDLLSDNFDSKQSRVAADLPLTCHPSPSLTTFAFRSREVRRLLLDLDPYGGTDPLGMFPLFLKRTDVMAPVLVKCFDGLFAWVVSCLAGDRPMSPQIRKVHRPIGHFFSSSQFRKVHRPPLLPITDRFP